MVHSIANFYDNEKLLVFDERYIKHAVYLKYIVIFFYLETVNQHL